MRNKSYPQLVVLVVYKKKDGKTWRGFCAPFDVTCEAKSHKAAMTLLEELVECYMEGLKQYDYPEHLTIKELSNPEDKKAFIPILKDIAKMVQEMISKRFYLYVEEGAKIEIKKQNIHAYSFNNLIAI